jgi:DNA invertase Pin-like site-specific DNA recombinase
MKERLTLGYVRCSTAGQVESGYTLEAQRIKIEAYCGLHDMALCEIIEDAGLSGKSISGRPGVQRLLSLVKQGKVDNVIILKLDRLARNVSEASQIADLLQKKDTALHSVQERLDTGSASGRLFFNILSAMASWEREIISERTITALGVKRDKQHRISRFAPYGYRFDKAGNVIHDELEQTTIKKILELKDDSYTIRLIISYLDSHGYHNRRGKPFGVREIWQITKKAA